MATVDRINGLTGNLGIKAPVRCATTANITLSGLQTIDSITVVAGDRVLVKNQTTQTENGIYAASSTAWQREPDFNGNRDIVKGTLVRVNEGSVAAGKAYAVTTSDPITIGTSNLSFSASIAGSDLGTAAYENIGTSGSAIGLLNANKTDSGNNTFSGVNNFDNNVIIANATPRLVIFENDATANEGRTVLVGDSGDFVIGTATDASNAVVAQILKVERTGTTIDAVRFPNGINPNSTGGSSLTRFGDGLTWTPAIEGATTAGTATYSTQVGRYFEIGNWVYVDFSITLTAFTGTGQIKITGLPVAPASSTAPNVAISVTGLTFGAITPVFAATSGTSTFLALTNWSNSGNSSSLVETEITPASSSFRGGLWYRR